MSTPPYITFLFRPSSTYTHDTCLWRIRQPPVTSRNKAASKVGLTYANRTFHCTGMPFILILLITIISRHYPVEFTNNETQVAHTEAHIGLYEPISDEVTLYPGGG